MNHIEPSIQRSNRRQFLKTTLGAGLCAPALLTSCASGAKATTNKKPWQMKLSTSSVQYRTETLEEAVRHISRLGFEGIDIWSHFDWGGPLCQHLEEGFNLGVEKFTALLRSNNLKLSAATSYRKPTDTYARELGQMGGTVVVRGSSNKYGKGADLGYGELRASMEKFIESIRAEADVLGQHQCTLAIENHGGKALLNTADSFKLFREFNNIPNVGLALAPYHIQRTPEPVPELIRICGDQLMFFYAWQLEGGSKQLPGIGPVDTGPWMQALADINYQGYVNPFMHGETTPEEMDAYLQRSRDYLISRYDTLHS
ncbi:MAG: TIM barrel protein [Opitutales bacterium]